MSSLSTKFLKILGSILLFFKGQWCEPPDRIRKEYYYWPMFLAQQHLINMTAELLHDVEYKMVRAGKIHDVFVGTKDFEVGFIASYVQSRFRHMCELYRYVTEMEGFQWYTTLEEVINAQMFLQSDYHEILAMKDLFLEVIRIHTSDRKGRAKERFANLLRHIQHGGLLPGARRAAIDRALEEENYMKNSSDVAEFTNALKDNFKLKWRNISDMSREIGRVIDLK